MPIQFPRGFIITADEPIDIKLVLTKAQMAEAEVLFNMPDQYFCLCKDDNKIYIYDKYNHPVMQNPNHIFYGLGHFRPLKIRLADGDGVKITNEDTLHVDLAEVDSAEFRQMIETFSPSILKTYVDEEVKHYEK